jgi:hypothetical protein
MKYLGAVLVLLAGTFALAQSDETLRQSADAQMAPRALLLTGGPLDSDRGLYVIEFPFPNECLSLPPIPASSRPMALYRAVSQGGFSLLPSKAGLTVWTIEEWESFVKENPKFVAEFKKHCAAKK